MASFNDKIVKKVRSIVQTNTDYFKRNVLQVLPHIMDFSYNALKHSSPSLTGLEYGQILNVVKSKSTQYSSLASGIEVIRKDSTPFDMIVLVKDAEFGTYILAKNYSSIQRTLSNVLKNIDNSSEYTGSESKVSVTYLASDKLEQARAPLAEKLQAALNDIPFSVASAKILDYLDRLYNEHEIQASTIFNKQNLQSFSNVLGSGTVLVSLQTSKANNELATKVTNKISSEVNAYLNSPQFVKDLPDLKIEDDLAQQVVAILEGRKYKSSHTSSKPTKDVTKFKTSSNSKKITKVETPKLRDKTTGRFLSPSSLTALLNFHLHDVVAANMGDGDERKILNYRTGRFATSTVVERVSQSREGLVTAFYNYMRNPYATFSDGGAQQYPRSRDPKLLISKSIKQIAERIVGNRMRAILV